MNKISTALIMGIALFDSAQAQDAAVSQWSGEAELGIVSTDGNTETQAISAKAKAVYQRSKWQHEANLEALNTEDKNTTTAERYIASGKSKYNFSDLDYGFGLVTYEDDRFSGYKWRASEYIGYGRRVIKQNTITLDLEAAPGARQSKDNNGVDYHEAAIRLAADFGWQVSDTSKFTEVITSEIGEDVTISKSVTALKSQINGSLAMKVTYTVKHVSEVPASIQKVDRETTVTLVYSF